MAKAYSCRPSQILEISGIQAFNIDRAVMHFGEGFDSSLQAATDPGNGKVKVSQAQIQGKVNKVYADWLDDDSYRKFRDPSKR